MTGPEIRNSDGTVRAGRSVPPGEITSIEVDDPILTFIRVDHLSRLQFGATEVCIGAAFSLTVREDRHDLDPGERGDLGPFLGVYPDVLEAAFVDESCALHLRFESGTTLRVPADPHFEAWEINGPGTRRIVCQPGGEGLAIWQQVS